MSQIDQTALSQRTTHSQGALSVEREPVEDFKSEPLPGASWTSKDLRPLQRRSSKSGGLKGQEAQGVAAAGTAGSGSSLPHLGTIQRSFGGHDVTGVQAHTGAAASAAAADLGAHAFATGDQVAFAAGHADLHTAAHEAAHVVQQRSGVQLKGGVGQEGDAYERHADQVADKVTRGESAEALLSEMAGPVESAGPSLQRKVGDAIQRLGGEGSAPTPAPESKDDSASLESGEASGESAKAAGEGAKAADEGAKAPDESTTPPVDETSEVEGGGKKSPGEQREADFNKLAEFGVPKIELDPLTPPDMSALAVAFENPDTKSAHKAIGALGARYGDRRAKVFKALHAKKHDPAMLRKDKELAGLAGLADVQAPGFESSESDIKKFEGFKKRKDLPGTKTTVEANKRTIDNRREAYPDDEGLAGLSDTEAAAIYGYTTQDYLLMNPVLRGADEVLPAGVRDKKKALKREEIIPYIKTATGALDKLPTFEKSPLYRGTALPQAVLETAVVGGYISDPAFQSTTTNKSVASNAIAGNAPKHLIIIESHHSGKDVSVLTAHPEEKEILFRPGTRFKISRREVLKRPEKSIRIKFYVDEA